MRGLPRIQHFEDGGSDSGPSGDSGYSGWSDSASFSDFGTSWGDTTTSGGWADSAAWSDPGASWSDAGSAPGGGGNWAGDNAGVSYGQAGVGDQGFGTGTFATDTSGGNFSGDFGGGGGWGTPSFSDYGGGGGGYYGGNVSGGLYGDFGGGGYYGGGFDTSGGPGYAGNYYGGDITGQTAGTYGLDNTYGDLGWGNTGITAPWGGPTGAGDLYGTAPTGLDFNPTGYQTAQLSPTDLALEPGLGRAGADLLAFGPFVGTAVLGGIPAAVMAGAHYAGLSGLFAHDQPQANPLADPTRSMDVEYVTPQEFQQMQEQQAQSLPTVNVNAPPMAQETPQAPSNAQTAQAAPTAQEVAQAAAQQQAQAAPATAQEAAAQAAAQQAAAQAAPSGGLLSGYPGSAQPSQPVAPSEPSVPSDFVSPADVSTPAYPMATPETAPALPSNSPAGLASLPSVFTAQTAAAARGAAPSAAAAVAAARSASPNLVSNFLSGMVPLSAPAPSGGAGDTLSNLLDMLNPISRAEARGRGSGRGRDQQVAGRIRAMPGAGAPNYPGSTQYPGSENTFANTSATKGAQPYQGIIIHSNSGFNDMQGLANWMMGKGTESNPKSLGYQYAIDRNGQIYQFGDPASSRSNHISGTSGRSSQFHLTNRNSLGIALEGVDSKNPPTAEQLQALRGLVPWAQQTFNIPQGQVFGHGEVQGKDEYRAHLGPGNTPEGRDIAQEFRGPSSQTGRVAESKWGTGVAAMPGKTGVPLTAISQALASSRANVMAELKSSPGLAAQFGRMAHAEVGAQGPEAIQAFMETAINRATADGRSLQSVLADRGYFPGKTFTAAARAKLDSDTVAMLNAMLNAIGRGSNVANFATGNASRDKSGREVVFGSGPQTAAYGPSGRAERFGIESAAGHMAWAQSVGYRGPASLDAQGGKSAAIAWSNSGARGYYGSTPSNTSYALAGDPGLTTGAAPTAVANLPPASPSVAPPTQQMPVAPPMTPAEMTGPGFPSQAGREFAPAVYQGREGTQAEYGTNYGPGPPQVGPFEGTQADYGRDYGRGPPAVTGPYITAQSEYGANYGVPPHIGIDLSDLSQLPTLPPEVIGPPMSLAPPYPGAEQPGPPVSLAPPHPGEIAGPPLSLAPPYPGAERAGPPVSLAPPYPGPEAGPPLSLAPPYAGPETAGPPLSLAPPYPGAETAGPPISLAPPYPGAEIAGPPLSLAPPYPGAETAGPPLSLAPPHPGEIAGTPLSLAPPYPGPEVGPPVSLAPPYPGAEQPGPPLSLAPEFADAPSWDEAGMTITGKGDLPATPFDARYGDWPAPEYAGPFAGPDVVGARNAPITPAQREAPAPDIALTPPARGMTDKGLQAREAAGIITQAAKGLGKDAGLADFKAAIDKSAAAMARAGIPADIARGAMLDAARSGLAARGLTMESYGGLVGSTINGTITTAMMGYHAAAPGPAQGPGLPVQTQVANLPPAPPSVAPPVQDMPTAPTGLPTAPESLPPMEPLSSPMPHATGPGGITEIDETAPPAPATTPVAPETAVPDAREAARADPQTTQQIISTNPQAVTNIANSYGVDMATAAMLLVFLWMGAGEERKRQPWEMAEGGRVYYVPQGSRGDDFGRWPKAPTPDYPGKVAGYGREIARQEYARRDAQRRELYESMARAAEEGQIKINPQNWERFIRESPRSTNIEDRREKDETMGAGYQQGGSIPWGQDWGKEDNDGWR